MPNQSEQVGARAAAKSFGEVCAEQEQRTPAECLADTPPELRHLYQDETDPLYMWPLPPRGELPW